MAQAPITTIPPFADTAKLPACASQCGPLYDANGACVPPAAAVAADGSVYESCFCSNANVSPLSTATVGVCDNVCQGDGVASIATWFRDLCKVGSDDSDGGNNGGNDNNDGGEITTTTTTGSNSDSSGSNGSDSGGGGDWLSNHWQWVIMLVVLVVGIAGIWIGACIWRRRYLKKKDRQTTLGQKQSGSVAHPSWGPGFADPNTFNFSENNIAPTPQSDDPRTKGSFMPGAAAAALDEKSTRKEKKKWIVKSRT